MTNRASTAPEDLGGSPVTATAPQPARTGSWRSSWIVVMPRATRAGVIAGLVLYLSAAALAAVSMPWRGTGDSFFHLDYVYQLWHGHIPEPYGSEFRFPWQQDSAALDAQRQYASAHPPLFYAIAAPLMGPLMDAGQWAMAVAVGRSINIVAGAVTFVTLAWFGWTFGGRIRNGMAVLLPTAGVLTTTFLRFSADVYNDILVTTFTVLAVAITALIMRDGPSWRRVLPLAAVAAAGLATKATFLPTLALVFVAVVASTIVHRRDGVVRSALRGVGWCVPIGLVPAAAIGWFYVRNLALSGSWVRSTPKAPLQGRPGRTLTENLTSPDFYLLYPRGFFGNSIWTTGPVTNRHLSTAMVVLALCAVAAWFLRHRVWRRGSFAGTWMLGALLLAQLAALQVAQLYHATGYGAYNWRYFLPATMQAGLIIAAGTLVWGRRAVPAAVTAVVLLLVASIGNSAAYLGRTAQDVVGTASGWDSLVAVTAANGFPPAVATALALVAVPAVVVLAVSLWRGTPATGTVDWSVPPEPADR